MAAAITRQSADADEGTEHEEWRRVVRPLLSRRRDPDLDRLDALRIRIMAVNRHFEAEGFGMDLRPGLANVRCPTLVIAGERDVLVPAHLGQEIIDALPPGLGRLEVVRTHRMKSSQMALLRPGSSSATSSARSANQATPPPGIWTRRSVTSASPARVSLPSEARHRAFRHDGAIVTLSAAAPDPPQPETAATRSPLLRQASRSRSRCCTWAAGRRSGRHGSWRRGRRCGSECLTGNSTGPRLGRQRLGQPNLSHLASRTPRFGSQCGVDRENSPGRRRR